MWRNGRQRFVVPLVMLLAVSIAYDAAFAKGGTLHLFSSDVRLPIVSEPVNSPSLVLAGCGSIAFYVKVSAAPNLGP